MKKLFLVLVGGVIIFTSCRSHGPLCPAYSSVKKAPQQNTVQTIKTTQEKPC